jgi:hypothetical protein
MVLSKADEIGWVSKFGPSEGSTGHKSGQNPKVWIKKKALTILYLMLKTEI